VPVGVGERAVVETDGLVVGVGERCGRFGRLGLVVVTDT
jgi:hypothetical protein